MKLSWLVNDIAKPTLQAEHGLAFWIETPHGNVLFDTGGSGTVLLHNAAQMNIDLSTANALVLSHAHDDHTGGLPAVLPLLPTDVPIYANPTLFQPRYSNSSGAMLSRGMPLPRKSLAPHPLRLEAQPQEVLPDIWTSGEITTRDLPEGRSRHHFIRQQNSYLPDPYQDDLSLILETAEGLILLCGCCHAGLLNTLHHVRDRWSAPLIGIIGGLHLRNAPADVLHQTVQEIIALPKLRFVWPGHCSGKSFFDAIQRAIGARYLIGQAGQRLNTIKPIL